MSDVETQVRFTVGIAISAFPSADGMFAREEAE